MTPTKSATDPNDNETPLEGLEHLVHDFLLKRKTELQELDTFIAQKDFDQIRQLTHKWKGYSAPYGFGRLGALAEAMNTLAHDKNAEECKTLFALMKTYLSQKEAQLKN